MDIWSAASDRNGERANGMGLGVSSASLLKLAINVMKSLNEKCSDKALVVNSPELADYVVRLDRDRLTPCPTR
jgi:hypothetical protein